MSGDTLDLEGSLNLRLCLIMAQHAGGSASRCVLSSSLRYTRRSFGYPPRTHTLCPPSLPTNDIDLNTNKHALTQISLHILDGIFVSTGVVFTFNPVLLCPSCQHLSSFFNLWVEQLGRGG